MGVCDLGCHRGRRHNARTGLVRAIRVTRNLAGGANAATVTTRISTTGFGTGTPIESMNASVVAASATSSFALQSRQLRLDNRSNLFLHGFLDIENVGESHVV